MLLNNLLVAVASLTSVTLKLSVYNEENDVDNAIAW